jgi:sensor histidine kinase YesM
MYLLDERLLIPEYISRYGCYSSACIMVASIFAAIHKFYVISTMAFVQSILSYFNWRAVKMFSVVKMMDIILACLILLHVTFIDSAKFRPEYQRLWVFTLVIVLAIFTMNEFLLYYQVKTPVYDSDPNNNQYFSLAYTQPGTMEREYAYYRSTLTHICFIHILPVFVIGFCIYTSCSA